MERVLRAHQTLDLLLKLEQLAEKIEVGRDYGPQSLHVSAHTKNNYSRKQVGYSTQVETTGKT